MSTTFARFVLRNRWFIVIVSTLLIFAAAFGGKNLAFTTEYRDFFAPGNPQFEAFERMQNTYDKSDNVMILLSNRDGSSLFTNETLEDIRWLTEQAWQMPYSTRVDSITNFQYTVADGDDLMVADLVADPLSLTLAGREEILRVALNEPLLVKRLVNSDGTVTGVNITVQLPGLDINETPQIALFARDLAGKLMIRNPQLATHITGIVMMNNAFGESSKADMATLVPLMFLVVILVLWFMLRSVSGTIATVLVIFMSIAAAMGLFGWYGAKLTPPTASAPTIILTMAVADAVHLLISFLWGMRNGMAKNEAMVESIRINFSPIFLTSLTTALGFLSMNFSEVPPLAHLGNVVAAGVVVAFILSVTFLPALVMILPVRARVQEQRSDVWVSWLGDFVVHRRKPLLWGMVFVSLVAISFVPRNQLNDEFVKYFAPSVDFRADSDFASEKLVGPYTIEYSIGASTAGGISDPDFLRKVEQLVEQMYTYPEVVHVLTLTDTLKRLNKNMHGDDPSFYRLPNDRELAAQYLLLYELSLPYGLDLNNQIDIDKSSLRLTMTTTNLSSNQVLGLELQMRRWIAQNMSDYSVEAASPNLMFAHIGYRNARSLMLGTGLTLLAISLILVFALRSIKIGLISLVPNLVPAGIAFGIWGVLDGQIGMSVSIVAGMTLGIVVDDTVHFLSKYLRARREKGFDAQQATHYAFTHVGKALIVTTLVLVVGFSVLAVSTFKMNADMGLVTALTIAIALLVDFLLLPPLLMLFDRSKTAVVHLPLENTDSVLAKESIV